MEQTKKNLTHKWYLMKYTYDLFEFLNLNPNASKTKRGEWTENWLHEKGNETWALAQEMAIEDLEK